MNEKIAIEHLSQEEKYEGQNYQSMSILALKRQRMKMLDELRELHETIQNKVFKIQKDSSHIREKIFNSVKFNNRILKTLQSSLDNFDFMLTHQYIKKVEEEIQNDKKKKKVIQRQINNLKKELSLSKEEEIQKVQEKQKFFYEIEIKTSEMVNSNDKKNQLLLETRQKTKLKIKQHNLLKKKQEELSELIEDKRVEKLDQSEKKKFDELSKRKQKISYIINKFSKANHYLMKKQISSLRKTEKNISFLNACIQQTQELIQVKNLQLKNEKMKKMKKNDFSFRKNKIFYTEQSSFNESKDRKKGEKGGFQLAKGESLEKRSSLPSIYTLIGKNRLLIEEDCDLKQIVYQ